MNSKRNIHIITWLMTRVALATVILGSLISTNLLADEWEEKYKPGTQVSGHLAIGPGNQTIAMPEGKWTIAFFQTSLNNVDTLFAKGFLFQQEDNRLTKGVWLQVPLNYNANGYISSKNCERTNLHFIEKIENADSGNQNCYYVNHYRVTLSGSKSAIVNKIGKYFLTRKIQVPNHLFQIGHRLADVSSMLIVKYYFSPTTDGFEDHPRTNWTDSPWHPSAITNDPRKTQYVGKLINWSKQWHPVVVKGFQGKLAPGDTVKVTDEEKAPATISSTVEERLKKLKRLFDENLITSEEYEGQRKEILNSL
jgi:hypothetical protein